MNPDADQSTEIMGGLYHTNVLQIVSVFLGGRQKESKIMLVGLM